MPKGNLKNDTPSLIGLGNRKGQITLGGHASYGSKSQKEKVRRKIKNSQVITFSNCSADIPPRRTPLELLHKLRDFSRNVTLKCRVCRICIM